MVELRWLPNWKAYSVRRNGCTIGMVRCSMPPPFRIAVKFT